jgi:hypothetical protein
MNAHSKRSEPSTRDHRSHRSGPPVKTGGEQASTKRATAPSNRWECTWLVERASHALAVAHAAAETARAMSAVYSGSTNVSDVWW